MQKAVPKVGAAFALSCLLVLGFVPLGSFGFAETPSSGTHGAPVVETATEDSEHEGTATETPDEPAETGDTIESIAPPVESEPSLDDAASNEPAETPTPPTTPETPNPPSENPGATEKPTANKTWLIGSDEVDAVTAELLPDGTLVVSGFGSTIRFDEVENADGSQAVTTPWLVDGYAKDIKQVIFAKETVPESLAYWFDGCENLVAVSQIPASVVDLTSAFRGCKQLKEAPALPENARLITSTFEGCSLIALVPSIPASVQDAASAFEGCTALASVPACKGAPAAMSRMFFDCPSIVEIPEAFTFGAAAQACFGFTAAPVEPLATAYAGSDEAVLAYAWQADGRELIIPETPEPPAEGGSGEQIEGDNPADVVKDPSDAGTKPDDPLADDKEQADNATPAPAPKPIVDAKDPTPKQVSITVPSSVPMLLNENGQASAEIPVSVANRSDTAVRVVGVRLKRESVDLPGGSWSFVSQETGTHFVDGARFTPGGQEAVLTTPVELAPHSAERLFVWQGSFSDYDMKNLLQWSSDSEGSFAYGTMIWHIEAV